MSNIIGQISDNWALNSGTNPLIPSDVQSTYSPTWRQTYLDNQLHKSDPVAHKAMTALIRRKPININQTDYSGSMFEEANACGAAANVVCTSYFGGNIMIIGAVVDAPNSSTLHAELQKSLGATHRASIIGKLEQLTDRQLDVMELAEMGMTAAQIAADMGVSTQAVAKHKAAICKALSLRSFSAAVNAYSLEKWSPFMK